MGGAGLQASDDGVQTCDDGLQTCDEGVQTCVLACAALEQLCREGAWCRALVQRDVVPLLERLVRHEEDEVVHHAAGALPPPLTATRTLTLTLTLT